MSDLREDNLLNRATRRQFERTNPSCRKCGIRWKERFDQWSLCTVRQPADIAAEGHSFL